MSTFDQRFVLVAFGVLAALVLAVGALLIVEPQLSKASSVTRQIGVARSQYESLHTRPAAGPSLDATPVFELTRAMPTTDDMPDALVELARLAQATSATLVSVKPSAAVPLANGASALPVQLTVDGSWTQVMSFLARVRNEVRANGSAYRVDGRLFDVDQVQVSPAAKGTGIEAVLTLNAFEYTGVTTTSTPTTTTSTTETTTTTSTPPSSAQALGATGGGS